MKVSYLVFGETTAAGPDRIRPDGGLTRAVAAGAVMPGVSSNISEIFSKVSSVMAAANNTYAGVPHIRFSSLPYAADRL